MFSEVLHGLIGRVQKDSDVDHNNPKVPLSRCNMRIGIIPAGKGTNYVHADLILFCFVCDFVTLTFLLSDAAHFNIPYVTLHCSQSYFKYGTELAYQNDYAFWFMLASIRFKPPAYTH